MKKIIFSGIQPSGVIHLGNYIGAIKQWLNYISEYECFFCIVDAHAITVRQNPKELQKNVKKLAALYLACGLDPKEAILFVQSHVPAHTELAWILNCYTQLGELERMTQFKEKAKENKENINVGLFDYPVLMAADILLYQTNLVPVGEDQKQHVELCRDIAKRFNRLHGNIFTMPEPMIPKIGARIMGLDDPSKKMSKSAKSEYNYISLLDAPKIITKKIMRAVTDSGSEIKFDEKNKPAVSNLLTIYSLVSGRSVQDIEKEYVGKGYGDFKKGLTEVVLKFILPIQERYNEFIEHEGHLDKILEEGAIKAESKSRIVLEKVKQAIGLI